MNLIIKSEEAERIATKLAESSGSTVDDVVLAALKEKEQREQTPAKPDRRGIAEKLLAHGRAYAALPDRDTRTADEIIGYDENGLPT